MLLIYTDEKAWAGSDQARQAIVREYDEVGDALRDAVGRGGSIVGGQRPAAGYGSIDVPPVRQRRPATAPAHSR